MKFDLRYPMHFRGKPKGNSRDRDIVCARRLTVDVPEISEREAGTVAFAKEGVKHILSYDGRAYMLLGADGPGLRERLLKAFVRLDYQQNPYIVSISDDEQFRASAGKPLQNLITRRLFLSGHVAGAKQWDDTWPTLSTYHGSRDNFEYPDVLSKVPSYDGDTIEEAVAMHEAEASRLLLVGNELWLAAGDPCLVVSQEGWQAGAEMRIEIGFAPRWFDTNLARRCFPLSQHAEAVEYATVAQRRTENASAPHTDYSWEWDVVDPTAFEFDPAEREIARITCLLAADTLRCLPDLPDIGPVPAIHEAVQASFDTNHVTGSHPKVDHLVGAVTETWKAARRPRGMAQIPPVRRSFADMLIADVVEAAANTSINIEETAAPSRPR